MTEYYFRGCKYLAHNPEGTQKLFEYLKKHGVSLLECCSVDCVIPNEEDTVIFQCPTCGLILEESARKKKMISIYEYLLDKDDFPWPDYGGAELTVQDCWRMRKHPEYQKAIREVLKKMNIRSLEIEQNFEKTDFCGRTLYQVPSSRYERLAPHNLVEKGCFHPQSEEKQLELMKENSLRYPTHRVVCYCTGCLKGISDGGNEGIHVLDLILADTCGVNSFVEKDSDKSKQRKDSYDIFSKQS